MDIDVVNATLASGKVMHILSPMQMRSTTSETDTEPWGPSPEGGDCSKYSQSLHSCWPKMECSRLKSTMADWDKIYFVFAYIHRCGRYELYLLREIAKLISRIWNGLRRYMQRTCYKRGRLNQGFSGLVKSQGRNFRDTAWTNSIEVVQIEWTSTWEGSKKAWTLSVKENRNVVWRK